MLVEWLAPVAAFWTLAAIYLGATPIRIEGGGGLRQIGGLLVTFALFLGVFAAARAILSGTLGVTLTVIVGTAAASLLLPILCRVGFRVLGVRIAGA
ncbi:MAG: hypothetical protein GWM92_04435 [Gemmatimonadetes bacterium]|nr:hypothetical protein [Gemmatimonadota bacterium]NIR77789.1 hypothetical protein [Gemmatimonadota bacterium]NIT86365.1 hypothetical protein [Gemmatimonadota bacterium]NIU30202.1 hypothetical protein [Gemmatimonadota bacterium]NIU35096.1 hypothetical protein [Gemmatimonadota bacterium]